MDHVDCRDDEAMLSVIRNKLYASEAHPDFLSLMMHICLLEAEGMCVTGGY